MDVQISTFWDNLHQTVHHLQYTLFCKNHISWIHKQLKTNISLKRESNNLQQTPLKQLTEYYKNLWNRIYISSPKASHTKIYFPNIHCRLQTNFQPNFILTQFLTNHGNFLQYLQQNWQNNTNMHMWRVTDSCPSPHPMPTIRQF